MGDSVLCALPVLLVANLVITITSLYDLTIYIYSFYIQYSQTTTLDILHTLSPSGYNAPSPIHTFKQSDVLSFSFG